MHTHTCTTYTCAPFKYTCMYEKLSFLEGLLSGGSWVVVSRVTVVIAAELKPFTLNALNPEP